MWRQNGRACWSAGGAGRLLESESESEPKLECQSRSVGAGVLKLECCGYFGEVDGIVANVMTAGQERPEFYYNL